MLKYIIMNAITKDPLKNELDQIIEFTSRANASRWLKQEFPTLVKTNNHRFKFGLRPPITVLHDPVKIVRVTK
ncbi:hypothetical protein N6G95_08760 [Pediococcus inopinatus]|uniref:hypothetical protein n=1 Tax=Pediococcus inopinatus TaxID=114090 RepID=UPI002B25DD4D|nr:hypothetical protein [Pediococcus inopinatus]WPC19312.1 hypothetical protein N6G95_08760 [Pediococcus inopinatus]